MPDFIKQLRFRLLELGCPVGRTQRVVQEVADHWEDLMEAASAEGVTAPAAGAWVERRLGNPKALAEELTTTWRRATWYARHPLIAFGLLPLLMFPVCWSLALFLFLSAEFGIFFGWDNEVLRAAANDPTTFGYLAKALQGADCAALTLVVLVFCFLGYRSGVGLKWMTLGIFICAIYSLFIFMHVVPHSFFIGVTWKPQWMRAAGPLLMVSLAYWNWRKQVRDALKASV